MGLTLFRQSRGRSTHLQAIIDHSNRDVVDACLINNARAPKDALGRYEEEVSFPVEPDVKEIREMGYKVEATDLLGVTDYVRHDSSKLNAAIIQLIETHRVIKR